MFSKKFETPTAHQQQRDAIKSIRLAEYQRVNQISSNADALRKIVEHRRIKAPLCGPQYQDDTDPMDYLSEYILMGEPWASETIAKRMREHDTSFEDFAVSLVSRANELDKNIPGSPMTNPAQRSKMFLSRTMKHCTTQVTTYWAPLATPLLTVTPTAPLASFTSKHSTELVSCYGALLCETLTRVPYCCAKHAHVSRTEYSTPKFID
jgi:hypothetical protein